MSHENGARPTVNNNSFAALRRFVSERKAVERCELCSLELPPEHQHLFVPAERQLLCACDACALLFDNPAATKYRRVPRQGRYLPEFQLDDALWDDLLIPVGMAFFFFSTPAEKVMAYYPSPAGPTESLLRLEAWDEIVSANPILQTMQPDVEALLVNRLGEPQYFIAPIDKCYELVGLIRMHWSGLSGGTEVWAEIAKFFTILKANSATEEAKFA